MEDCAGRTRRFGTMLTLLVIGLTGALQHADASASATPPEPISVDNAVATINAGGAVVAFVNQTGVDLTVSGKLAGTGKPIMSDPNPVPAGESATLTVPIDEPDALLDDARLVVIVAPTTGLPDGWVTRLPFAADDAKAPAEPAVDSWHMIFYSGFSPRLADQRDTDIPLKNTGSCDAVDLPDLIPVGRLEAEGATVKITASCRKLSDGSLVAALDVGPADATGRDYAGSIDLDPDDKTSGSVDLTARRTLHPLAFGLLLAAGIAFALLIRWWTTSGKLIAEQLRRISDLRGAVIGARPENPLEMFSKITRDAGLTDISQWDLGTSIFAELMTSDDELRSLAGPWNPKGATTTTYRSATARIDDVDTALAAWPSLANALVRLSTVAPNLTSLPKVEEPILDATLRRSEGDIGLDEVATISAAVERGLEVASVWPHERYLAAVERFKILKDMTAEDDEFTQAKGTAMARWKQFDDQRADAANDGQIKAAGTLLYDAIGLAEEAMASYPASAPGNLTARTASAPAPHGRDALKEWSGQRQVTGDSIVWMQRIFDGLVIAAVLLVAIVAGTKALYIDQAVGGWWDSLVIVTWGFAAAAVAEPISAAIQSVSDGLRRESASDTP